MDCPELMSFKYCGSQDQSTCFDRHGKTNGPCQEGCFCKPDLVSDGDECIYPNSCGCVWEGQMYKVSTIIKESCIYLSVQFGMNMQHVISLQIGETFLTTDCAQTCTCTKTSREVQCQKSDCAKNSMCTIENGHRVCICPPSYKGNGQACLRK